MRTTEEDATVFREECLYWQQALGLTDWALQFHTAEAPEDNAVEATTDYDCDTRHARVVYFLGIDDCLHPCDVALHEMIHLLFADMLDRDDDREEHRVIERLLKVLPRKRRRA